jgi:CubicO group peptidase (beta-lactamase class C family)
MTAIHSVSSRRRFLTTAAGAIGALPFEIAYAKGDAVPTTGRANAALAPFDRLMTSFLAETKAPGASLAVSRHGRVIYARGFGFADIETKEPVQPTALFRIASVSKPITAVAVLQLIERNKLGLDDEVLDRMNLTAAKPSGAKPDPRWGRVTVRHCLQHTGGWDRGKSYDPIGRAAIIAKTLGVGFPVKPEHVVRYMMAQPLDFDPGERYAYSNLGYLVLGRVIEAVTGRPYEQYVRENVFAPLGVRTMKLGRALAEHRDSNEVKYYDVKNRKGPSIYPPHVGKPVPIQYGAQNFEGYEAHGGWIASAADLCRFAAAFDDSTKSRLLRQATVKEMWARPSGAAGYEPDGKPKASYYGLGWLVRPIGNAGKVNAWHSGNIAGTRALLVRRWDGLDWAVLFNTDQSGDGKSLADLIDSRLHDAARQVKTWPDEDVGRRG